MAEPLLSNVCCWFAAENARSTKSVSFQVGSASQLLDGVQCRGRGTHKTATRPIAKRYLRPILGNTDAFLWCFVKKATRLPLTRCRCHVLSPPHCWRSRCISRRIALQLLAILWAAGCVATKRAESCTIISTLQDGEGGVAEPRG
jgi:hypothetical protein